MKTIKEKKLKDLKKEYLEGLSKLKEINNKNLSDIKNNPYLQKKWDLVTRVIYFLRGKQLPHTQTEIALLHNINNYRLCLNNLKYNYKVQKQTIINYKKGVVSR